MQRFPHSEMPRFRHASWTAGQTYRSFEVGALRRATSTAHPAGVVQRSLIDSILQYRRRSAPFVDTASLACCQPSPISGSGGPRSLSVVRLPSRAVVLLVADLAQAKATKDLLDSAQIRDVTSRRAAAPPSP